MRADGPLVVPLCLTFFAAGFLLGGVIVVAQYQGSAIVRGYASYCPLTGDWAWNGECEK